MDDVYPVGTQRLRLTDTGELLSGIGMAELFVRARELGERTELLARTELLLLWYRDLLLWRETGSQKYIVNVDRLDQIRIQAGHVTTPMLVRGINAIEDIRRKLLANANNVFSFIIWRYLDHNGGISSSTIYLYFVLILK